MRRRQFLRTSAALSMSAKSIFLVLQGCALQKTSSNFQFTKGIVTLPRTEFVGFKSGKEKFLDFVIVKLEHLEFPIVIYKISESKFQAMSMRCTHQGCELTPYTTRLVCPCHGAEFNTDGTVAMGPAEDALQTFVTSADNSNVYIEI